MLTLVNMSEEMPRSEGITTPRCRDANGIPMRPRKCPDQRGLRHKTYTFNADILLMSPRKCPDQRGLRLNSWPGYTDWAAQSEEMPRSEGITTQAYHLGTLRDQ